MTGAIDVHQHLWPEPLVDRLRARSRTPYLRDWRLHTAGEPAYDVDPAHHGVAGRVADDLAAGVRLACVSLSAPLGIEGLPPREAQELLGAWHDGVHALPGHFRGWASVSTGEVDLAELEGLLALDRFVGLQLPATELLSPAAWERAGDVLGLLERADKALFVHPGPEPAQPLGDAQPAWWAPVVGYVAQLQAAWWGWHAVRGRSLFPGLRVLFAAGAGLAPVHHERHVARGGQPPTIDRDVFVDTSSYGPQALDALVRVLGIDVIALGSDRPYGVPLDRLLGDAATHAIRTANPHRLLTGAAGGETRREQDTVKGRTWPRAS
jgi:hypothetical protein